VTSAIEPIVPRGLDWLDRATCAYLLLPLLLFCAWFATPFAIALLALSSYGAYRALTGGTAESAAIGWSSLLAILGLSLACTAVAGVGNFFYANTDWFIRGAVLHDLVVTGWPPYYTDEHGASLILRAPVGYYLPAAAIGKLGGTAMAHTALYLWTVIGFALFLASACRLFQTAKQRMACILILLMFSGMDLLGYISRARQLPALGENVEWWLQIIQYPANTYLLAWVPNHALPAWLGIVMILRHWRLPTLSRITPLLSAAIPLWSPLAAIGLFPFFLFGLAWRRDWKTLISPHSSLPFLLPALAIASYEGLDAAAVPHRWFADFFPTTGSVLYFYVLFCLLEFGVLALVLSRLTAFTTPMRIAVVVLCLLPIYAYGPYNDVAMRSSIPALAILALATVRPLTDHKWSAWQALLGFVLFIGAIGALQEPIRGMLLPRWDPVDKPFPEAALLEHEDSSSSSRFPTHYFARPDKRGLSGFLRKPESDNTVHLEPAK